MKSFTMNFSFIFFVVFNQFHASPNIFLLLKDELHAPINQPGQYKYFMSTVIQQVAIEKDAPPCRWNTYSLSYQWGGNLQTPGSLWRNAFSAAVVDWSIAPIKFYFYNSSSGVVILNAYYLQDNYSGYAQPYCNGTITTKYEIFGNSFYSNTTNGYHAIAGHETGHGLSIGHHNDSAVIALMGNNPNPQVYYTPQQADIDLVNYIYP